MNEYLFVAQSAARKAGELLMENLGKPLEVNSLDPHDIKLKLDVESQELITKIILGAFPDHAILGEEGIDGNQNSEFQWIVDPIDGTVNYYYGIPHFCISIALRKNEEIIVGVIYDPTRDEIWTATRDQPTMLNDKPVQVSSRTDLSESIVCLGFAKETSTISRGMPLVERMMHKARKCRLMGSAALELAYVCCGRLDAFVESGLSLWDIAAGQILVEQAGGKITIHAMENPVGKLAVVAWNGITDLALDDQ